MHRASAETGVFLQVRRHGGNIGASVFKTSVSLVCLTEVELSDFGDVEKQLGETGSVEQTRESPFVGRDNLFVETWTCLALMTFVTSQCQCHTLRSMLRWRLEKLSPTIDNIVRVYAGKDQQDF